MNLSETVKAVAFAGLFFGSYAFQQSPLGANVNELQSHLHPQLITGCASTVSKQCPFKLSLSSFFIISGDLEVS